MALTGFPDPIYVTLGSQFDGSNRYLGLNSGDELTLTELGLFPGSFTEDGNSSGNKTTNRILLQLQSSNPNANAIVKMFNDGYGGWGGVAVPTTSGGWSGNFGITNAGADYTFKEVWSASPTANLSTVNGSFASNVAYNGGIFSFMGDGPEPVSTCWSLTARYMNSNRVYKLNGSGDFPNELRVPKNVDLSSASVIEHGKNLDVDDLNIIQ